MIYKRSLLKPKFLQITTKGKKKKKTSYSRNALLFNLIAMTGSYQLLLFQKFKILNGQILYLSLTHALFYKSSLP
jgi:K+-transporting ATPase A subunit